MRIAVATEVREEYKRQVGDPPDVERDLVSKAFLDDVLSCLEGLGFEASWIGDAQAVLSSSRSLLEQCDFVFNLAEGLSSPNRASGVPLLLELLGLPYFGSDAYSQALTLNKYHVELIARDLGVPTPGSHLVHSRPEVRELPSLEFPVIVKPVHEGSSIGISERSVVFTTKQLESIVGELLHTYRQPVLVQRFVTGFEVTMPIVANEEISFCQAMSVVMDDSDHLGEKIYSSDIKFLEDHRVEHVACRRLSSEAQARLAIDSLRVFRALGLRDYARCDYRLDEDGMWYLVDVNAIAYLGQDSSFARAFSSHGISYQEMIGRLLQESFERWGIQW